jgi:uncharacterized membrane protein YfcA
MMATSGLALFAYSLVASAIGGVLGMAGGILIVPILTACGLDIRTAIGASIVSVIASSCASAPPFLRSRLTNMRLAIVLELATTLGALSGVLLSGRLPAALLYVLFAAILLLSAWQMLARRAELVHSELASPDGLGTRLGLHSSYPDPVTGRETAYVIERLPPVTGRETAYVIERLPAAMGLMYGAGLVSALLGIGSGVLKIPALDAALRLPLKVSSATSNFMIGVTAAASAGAYFARGDIVPAIAGPVALGSVLGAVLGARVLLVASTKHLRSMFVVLLLLLAGQMLLQAFGVQLFGARL